MYLTNVADVEFVAVEIKHRNGSLNYTVLVSISE
jgi:hypothetical protein